MKKQLKEQSRVQQLLKDGLVINYYISNDCLATNTDNWKPTVHYSYGLADLALLIKWFSAQGLKPKKIKEEIIKLWYNYDPLVDYDILNKMIKRVRNVKKYELIEVNNVVVSDATMQWFKEQDLSHEAIKLLFTLFVWYKIQEQYREHPECICLDNAMTLLKRSANIKQNYKIIDLLRELYLGGYIDKPPLGKRQITVYVINNLSIIPDLLRDGNVPDGNGVTIEDFDHIGEFYEDYFGLSKTRHIKRPVDDVCPVCGKEFVHKSRRHDELCEDCAKIRDREKDRLKKQRKRERLKREKGKNDT